jgi:hypothetical protein
MAIAPDSAYAEMLAQKKKAPAPKVPTKLEPTVTIGGVQAGYKPAGTPNFITGENVPGVQTAPRGFRAAEDASNVGAPVYTPTPLSETGEFVEAPKSTTLPEGTLNKLVAPDGTVFDNAEAYAAYLGYLGNKQSAFDTQKRASQSAFDLMYAEFANYGLGSLVEPLRALVQNGISGDEFTLRLRETDAYKKRFAANSQRIAKGLTALSESEYLAKEDAYQNVMRNYGLPDSYYAKDSLGTQAGFEKLLTNDVSAPELEERIIQAKDKVLNANPEVAAALKAYYPGITEGNILAYVLDPTNALKEIQRKVAAAEIGGAALAQGLTAGVTRAEELAGLGITKAQAQAGYSEVAQIAPRGSELSAIYGQTPYGQSEAEAEVFNTSGAADAAKKRKKLTALETAQFSGQSGVGALGRDKALYGGSFGQAGQY